MPHRVAIVGSGVSGLAAASAFHENGMDFVLFESESYVGGHSRTEQVLALPSSYVILNIFIFIFMGLCWPRGVLELCSF